MQQQTNRQTLLVKYLTRHKMDLVIYENNPRLPPPYNFEAEINRLQEELIIERDLKLCVIADFKNYRRQIERDNNKIDEGNKREMMFPLLEIIDDIEKALDSAKEAEPYSIKELQKIHRKFLSFLEKNGIQPFECAGKPFNHSLHEVVELDINYGFEPRIVVGELRRGYLWNNELLWPAQVRVSG
jgi:molecular chaperone GrpE